MGAGRPDAEEAGHNKEGKIVMSFSVGDIISLYLTLDQSNHSFYVLKEDQIEEAEEKDAAIFVLQFIKTESGKFVQYPVQLTAIELNPKKEN